MPHTPCVQQMQAGPRLSALRAPSSCTGCHQGPARTLGIVVPEICKAVPPLQPMTCLPPSAARSFLWSQPQPGPSEPPSTAQAWDLVSTQLCVSQPLPRGFSFPASIQRAMNPNLVAWVPQGRGP